MHTWIVRNLAAGAAALSLIAAGDLASAQLFRRVYRRNRLFSQFNQRHLTRPNRFRPNPLRCHRRRKSPQWPQVRNLHSFRRSIRRRPFAAANSSARRSWIPVVRGSGLLRTSSSIRKRRGSSLY